MVSLVIKKNKLSLCILYLLFSYRLLRLVRSWEEMFGGMTHWLYLHLVP